MTDSKLGQFTLGTSGFASLSLRSAVAKPDAAYFRRQQATAKK